MALNFPAKIYQILENESADIIRWHNNGLSFRIVDHGKFEREIIPKYFRRKRISSSLFIFRSKIYFSRDFVCRFPSDNQISSVQRQLNLYGFKCISRGEDKGAFFHPQFRRGDWDVVRTITRYTPTKKPNECDNQPDYDNRYGYPIPWKTDAIPVPQSVQFTSKDPNDFDLSHEFGFFDAFYPSIPEILTVPETKPKVQMVEIGVNTVISQANDPHCNDCLVRQLNA